MILNVILFEKSTVNLYFYALCSAHTQIVVSDSYHNWPFVLLGINCLGSIFLSFDILIYIYVVIWTLMCTMTLILTGKSKPLK